MTAAVIDSARDDLTGADLRLDAGLNAAALDRSVSSGAYTAAEYGGNDSPAQSSPATIVITLDSRDIARAVVPDINALLGRTTTLQARGYAT